MNHFCMHCSVFENDEDVPGWKVGSSVAYCESCFEEKMTKEMNYEICRSKPANQKFKEQVCLQKRTL